MTTADVARDLGMTSEYVRGEILDGRLQAVWIERPGKRTVYRITPDQLAAYKARHCRGDVARGTSTQSNQ